MSAHSVFGLARKVAAMLTTEGYMRCFILRRDMDVSGVSGTGVVALGVQFSDGLVVLRWLGEHGSTVIWPSIEDAKAVHGHDGLTQVVWLARDAERAG